MYAEVAFFKLHPFLFTQNAGFVWFNIHDWILFFGNADFIKIQIFLQIFLCIFHNNHQIKSSEMWQRFLINLHLMLVVDQNEEKANSSSDWGSTLQSSHHPPVSPSASLSQSLPVDLCLVLWLEQTRASCGTETSSQSGIPLSVCLPTLWETWPNWWTWLLMTTRPTSAPARSISSECII